MTHELPYGRQWVTDEDVEAVTQVLRSAWLTTGPMVPKFEEAVTNYVGAKSAVAVSSGTAALHTAMYAVGIGPGDEVIVPSMTFVATANAVVYQGGTPVFADVSPDSLLIDPDDVERKITPHTKAIVAVDYAGQPCNYDRLSEIANRHGLALVADACHSLGAVYKGKRVGTVADVTAFSFHPVKLITTGEGGMAVSDNEAYAERMRIFRNHGITSDYRQRQKSGTWYYEMSDLGYNYRLTDLQCALGISQLKRLPAWLDRRRAIAAMYDKAIATVNSITSLKVAKDVSHAYHLYVVMLKPGEIGRDRTYVFSEMRRRGIGVNVHYIPVHLHPFYRKRFGTKEGLCPVAEQAYERIMTLPIFPAMRNEDVSAVVLALGEICE